ncbi:MAG TPA: radical SAM protein, partial [Planctomycetaceae bacterium]|nr:radical SAM protein [Planctomycetaceae bacterium]
SRPPKAILDEVRRLADQGCLEVTFIGQTVNSYKYRHGDGRITRLADLLAAANEVSGLRRIKFVTNYPRDMSRELLEAVRDLPKVCPYFHLPVQHGSNAQLKLMKRGYTVEQYEELLGQIRELVPEATVASDFIVGLCHETEADHQLSCRLIERAGFKNCFIFKYSPRPGTKAHETLADDVPEAVKRRRNNELLALQNRIGLEQNQRLIGQVVEVLVEGPSKLGGKSGAGERRQLNGRTCQERIVVFDGPEKLIGQFVHVRVGAVTPTTLMGSIVSPQPAPV